MEKNKHQTCEPLYKKVSTDLRNKILNGEYKEGDSLPSESTLCEIYGVSRITVRNALEELVSQELVAKRRGSGTTVTSLRPIGGETPFASFEDICRAAGKTPEIQLISYAQVFPTLSQAAFFGIGEDELIHEVWLLMSEDGLPTILEKNCYPNAFRSLADEYLSDLDGVRQADYKPGKYHSEHRITVCFSQLKEEKLLGLKRDSPLLLVESRMKTKDGVPCWISKQIIRPDRFEVRYYD